MSRHSFEPHIAQKVGLNAAVIYQNLKFWCEKNAANEKNIHDGKAWTYNSMKAFETLFPYLSGKQIRSALDRLEQDGLVEVGNFNKDARDRTKWYAIREDCNCPTGQMELPQRANSFAPEGEPLPDSKPDNKHTPQPPQGADLFGSLPEEVETSKLDHGFDEIWAAFPRKPNMPGKDICRKEYERALKKVSHEDLLRAVQAYARTREGQDPKFHSRLSKWLREGNYEGFLSKPEYRWQDLPERYQNALSEGRCPPSMRENGQPNAIARHWLAQFGVAAE
ncbi:MAG: hypothetical protein EpisKO_41390 [Epibacterium sp.]